ncbi:MAG: hypothetical protein WBM83_09630, partial [Flavobacteriaceae bacterium]
MRITPNPIFLNGYRFLKCAVFFLFLGFSLSVNAQNCPSITSPLNGSTGVPVNTVIRWSQVSGIDGYLISLGTSPGATDILNSRSAGLVNQFIPELGLPDDTRIYVTISLFVINGGLEVCPGEVFSTERITTPPSCTQLRNGNDALENNFGSISWAYASRATGYRVTIGTTPGGTELADNLDVGNVLSYRPTTALPMDQELFVRIVPYNDVGPSAPCPEERVIISEPEFDCSSFLPELDIPDQIGRCAGVEALAIPTEMVRASGVRWFRINEDQTETLISESEGFTPYDLGNYRFEAYNSLAANGAPVE